jgi:hypothetical protein
MARPKKYPDELIARGVRLALERSADVYFDSMALVRSRDAANVDVVATDDVHLAGELVGDRERAWLDDPCLPLQDQREAAQPREVRAGPSSTGLNLEPAGIQRNISCPAGRSRPRCAAGAP